MLKSEGSHTMLSENQKRGEIQVIYGPMFSGKSTELLRRIRRYTAANKQCLVLKYHLDTRYDVDNLSTHDLYVCLFFTVSNFNFVIESHGKHIPLLYLKMH